SIEGRAISGARVLGRGHSALGEKAPGAADPPEWGSEAVQPGRTGALPPSDQRTGTRDDAKRARAPPSGRKEDPGIRVTASHPGPGRRPPPARQGRRTDRRGGLPACREATEESQVPERQTGNRSPGERRCSPEERITRARQENADRWCWQDRRRATGVARQGD